MSKEVKKELDSLYSNIATEALSSGGLDALICILHMDVDEEPFHEDKMIIKEFDKNEWDSGCLLFKRLKTFEVKISNKAFLHVMCLISNPGECSVVVNYLSWLGRNKDMVVINDLLNVDKLRVMTRPFMHKIWETQKVEGSNYIDTKEAHNWEE